MPANAQQKEFLKSNFGMKDEDVEKVTDNILAIFNRFEILSKYEIEAEAVDSSYCSAGIRKGDKFVFSAMPILLKSDKSTAGLCMRCLGALTPFLNTISDKIVAGVDPNVTIWEVAECMDPGLGNGGLGKVRFKFIAKEI